jgi:putative ABC transport system permease protein
MLAAVTFGAVTVTFAVGLGASLDDIQAAKDHDNADVLVLTGSSSPYGPHRIVRGGTPVVPADPARIAATIAAQPGTSAYYAVAQTEVTVAGVGGAADVYAFTGDATWAGYQMVSGRWFHGRGEAVADGTLLAATGAGIGDTVILYDQGRPVPVRIVGEVFDPHTEPELLVAGSTFPGLGAGSYHIALRPGTDTAAYIRGLGAALGPYGAGVGAGDASGHSGTILAVGALTGLLTLMLVLVAGLGVLNTVVLDTRERVRDIGICKAIGMTPRQAVGMVLGSVVPAGLAGGVAGVPAGWGLHAVVIPAMGRAAGLDLPGQALHVYGAAEVAALGCGGLLIAVLGALLPATWAARARTATALRTE